MQDHCGCGGDRPTDPQEGWRKSLETIDLWTPYERMLQARASSGACIANIKQAERAEVLGLGAEVANLYRGRAERENNQTLRLTHAAEEALRARRESPDWADLSAQLNDLISRPETQELIGEYRQRWVEILLETDVAADDAGQMLEIWDEASESLSGGGMDGLLDWTQHRLERNHEIFQAPEYGRGPNSPLTAAQAACVAAVVAATLAALIACAYIPFCWCCLAPLIAWGAEAATAACARL